MLVLAFLIASTLIPTSTLMAQEADIPPMAKETITPLITKDLAGSPGEQVSDVHGRLSAGLFEPYPPPQCTGVGLRAGGLRRDAGERAEKKSRWGQARAFMKIPTIFTSLAGTQVVPSQQNSLCS